MDAINPKVGCRVGGKRYEILWSKRALCQLGRAEFADALGEVDDSNGPALFRRMCVFAYCMLVGKTPFAGPEDVAEALEDEETEPLMEAINKAITLGSKKEGDPDPLSENGPSPAST